jgi:hypothetical protein
MRHRTKGKVAFVVAFLAVVAVACNKGPAEEALAEADQALAAAKPDLEKYVPEELAPITSAAQQARALLDQGRYTDALKAAQGLPSKIRAAKAAAAAKHEQLVAAWNELSGSVPKLVKGVTARVAELVAARKLPRGMDEAGFATAQADLGSATRAWTEATAAFQGGDLPKAVETARDAKAKAEALAGMLGPTVVPAAPGREPPAAP